MEALTTSQSLQWEAWCFQDDLIAAQSMDELLAAKRRFPEEVRVWAMKAWKADGQYAAFEAKVERLRSMEALI